MAFFIEIVFPFAVVLFGGLARTFIRRHPLQKDYHLGVELTLACGAAAVAWWVETEKRLKIAHVPIEKVTECTNFLVGFGAFGVFILFAVLFIHQKIEENAEHDGPVVSHDWLRRFRLDWIPERLLHKDTLFLLILANVLGGFYLARFLHTIGEMP